ncbi:MAG: 30S ribosomal protein S9 [Candidatus Saccharibacteria bacterium]
MPKSASGQNFYAVGKRKTAVAQVIMTVGNGTVTVNDLPFESYFGTETLRSIVLNPLTLLGIEKSINLRAKVHGGGIHAQAESLRHAVSRALTVFNPEVRRTLKKQGFLTRDPRVKERKKPGLHRARRAPQFSKR